LAPTVGIAATGFGIRAGSFNFSIGDISKFFLHRQDQQILRLQSDRFSSDHRRPSTSTIGEYTAILFVSRQKSAVSRSAHGKSPELAIRSKFQEQKRQATEGNSHLEKSVKHPGVPLT
jgi:hypothetical protein